MESNAIKFADLYVILLRTKNESSLLKRILREGQGAYNQISIEFRIIFHSAFHMSGLVRVW